jgi:hypothetical protein
MNMKSSMFFNLLAGAACICVMSGTAYGATAADAQPLGSFGDWSVFSFEDAGAKVCFMSSKPQKTEASVQNIKRGEPAAFVTYWTSENAKNVFSVAAGFPYNDQKQPVIKIDGQEFNLLARGETAWAPDTEADDKIAAALQKGKALDVVSVSKRGTKVTDTYSLKGSGEAYKAMTDACSATAQ